MERGLLPACTVSAAAGASPEASSRSAWCSASKACTAAVAAADATELGLLAPPSSARQQPQLPQWYLCCFEAGD